MNTEVEKPVPGELSQFLEVLSGAARSGKAIIQCPAPGIARRTRRRLYRLYDHLPPGWRLVADGMMFKLNGSQIIIESKTALGVSDATEDKSLASASVRLNNPS